MIQTGGPRRTIGQVVKSIHDTSSPVRSVFFEGRSGDRAPVYNYYDDSGTELDESQWRIINNTNTESTETVDNGPSWYDRITNAITPNVAQETIKEEAKWQRAYELADTPEEKERIRQYRILKEGGQHGDLYKFFFGDRSSKYT